MRPHTHSIPKALIEVAGQPIIGHILDQLDRLGIRDVVLIVGHMGEKLVEYMEQERPGLRAHFVEQKEMNGLGHAVSLSEPVVGDQPALIVYGDTVFEGDLAGALDSDLDGKIGTCEVVDPSRFGVVELDGDRIVRMVEKPTEFVSNLAIVGVNFIRNTRLLYGCLRDLMAAGRTTRGEFQLTDAFQMMLERGAVMQPFAIDHWHDCGTPEALLQTNRHLLSRCGNTTEARDCIVIPPVWIAASAVVKNAVVGPYASIAEEAHVESSVMRDTIIGRKARVVCCLLEHSVVGREAFVQGTTQQLNIGDSSEISWGG